MFSCHGKYHFPENDFRLTNFFTFDPEISYSLIFTSNDFRKKRERERRESPDQRERKRRESDDRAGAIDDRRDRAARSSIYRRDRRDRAARSMRSRGAIDERARRTRIARRRSSDAHRSSARSSIDGAIDDPVAFLLLGFGFFA